MKPPPYDEQEPSKEHALEVNDGATWWGFAIGLAMLAMMFIVARDCARSQDEDQKRHQEYYDNWMKECRTERKQYECDHMWRKR